MDNLFLDEAARYLPLLDEAENQRSVIDTLVFPVLFGVVFLPGLALGIFLPKEISLTLLAIILISAVLFEVLLGKESINSVRKRYYRLAKAAGVEVSVAEKFYDKWNGLKTKAKNRIRDDIERAKNAKNN